MKLQDQMIICSLLLIPLFLFFIIMAYFYLKVKRDAMRYKFFAFRDNLLWLVATGKLSEDSFIFGEFYAITNKVVNHTEVLTFNKLIRALRADFGETGRSERIRKELDNIHDKEVLSVLASFLDAILFSMRGNSIFFQAIEKLAGFGFNVWINTMPPLVNLIKFVFKDQYTAYNIRKTIYAIHP